MSDDRAEFEEQKRAHARALGDDAEVARLNIALLEAADRHNYFYLWSWLGVPVIQTPTDIVIMQEILWATRPQVVVEVGVARGGSLVMTASMLELIGEGHVVGVDIDIRPHNRSAIESHPMSHRISLVEGSSLECIDEVRSLIPDGDRVMVVLDSHHSHAHVLEELKLYAPLVSAGQYLVVADTIIEHLPPQTHRPRPWGPGDNPATALAEWLAEGQDFDLDPFVDQRLLLASSPGGYLRRRTPG